MATRKRIAIAVAAAVVLAVAGAWAAGLFDAGPAAPEGAIAGDSVTVQVGDSSRLPGPIAAIVPSTAAGVTATLALLSVLAAAGVQWLRVSRRRRHGADVEPAGRR